MFNGIMPSRLGQAQPGTTRATRWLCARAWKVGPNYDMCT